MTSLLRRTYGFHGQGRTFQRALYDDFLRGVFVEIRFMSFKCIHPLARYERILGSLLYAVTQAFRSGFVLHHVRRAAHRIAHDTVSAFCSPDASARIATGVSTIAASIGITFPENIVFIGLSPSDDVN
jgi:hypothetical protein